MTILFAILLFSLLIFVHELGHFVAAKLSGVQVNEFSIFMGPAIFKKQVGETLYALRCIPFGGYCAMEGEDEESDNPRAFGAAAWWKRLIILVAGAAMNFIAGIVLLAIFFAPYETLPVPQIVSHVEESLIFDAGELQIGDRIMEIDGEKIYIAGDVSMLLQLNGADHHDLLILRDGQEIFFDDFYMEPYLTQTNEDGTVSKTYGFSFGYEDAGLANRLDYIWNTAKDYVRMVRLSLAMLLNGQAGLKDMSGPVGIVQQMSESAEAAGSAVKAIRTIVNFGALIAINLAVMNLLPIPALDGGRAVCLLITTAVEKVTKKKIDPKYEAYLHGAGMILLLGLMAVITFKDVFAIFK
ncbi:MAG: site-2 protease family protein [Oscillospiraceae bacterium]|nr:site-2 protease family protein [Oscillospiraceae bacterium]